MGRFNRDDKRPSGGFGRRSGGERSFGGGSRFGSRDGVRLEMFQATCSSCGTSCEVPFKPSGDRPVYCRDCFAKQGGGSERPQRFSSDRQERPRFEDKRMHDAVCAKCGNDCQVPFRPAAGKPIYCSNCFEKGVGGGSNSGGRDSAAVAEQLKMLNTKIDKLVALLTPHTAQAEQKSKDTQEEVILEEVVKEKKKKTRKKAARKET